MIGPIATNRRPQERARRTMIPCESWMVMEFRSLSRDVASEEAFFDWGSAEEIRVLVDWKGL